MQLRNKDSRVSIKLRNKYCIGLACSSGTEIQLGLQLSNKVTMHFRNAAQEPGIYGNMQSRIRTSVTFRQEAQEEELKGRLAAQEQRHQGRHATQELSL